jgi:peptidase A4-like protein
MTARATLLLAMSLTSLLGAQAAAPRDASAATVVSSNWAGYAVTGKTYRHASGTWIVSAVTCSTAAATYSATWVGIGGYSETATALEQTGTEADCNSGTATYSAWSELVPANARTLKMAVQPGDRMSASVDVRGTRVTLRLSNITRGTSYKRTERMAAPDVSSAEWIVEAPSGCTYSGTCRQLPLGDFGTVAFTNARATTVAGHTGTIGDPAWSATKVNLNQSGWGGGRGFSSVAPTRGALTSALAAGGSSFAVNYEKSAALGKAVVMQPALRRAAGY